MLHSQFRTAQQVLELKVKNTPDCAAQAAPAIRSAWPGIEGGKYAGVAAGTDGQPDHHVILLADKPPKALTWKEAIAWAESVGGFVPTRDESALLYAHLRDDFERDWHWTSTQYSDAYAWCQGFSYGSQRWVHKYGKLPARAVRRSILQSFIPSEGAPAEGGAA
jgi:hypothetical protein